MARKDSVPMNTFEFDGEKYKKASRHQKEWGNSLITELSLRGNEAILDLGCGDGGLTEELAQAVPEGNVLGIDASAGMIETARQRKRDNLEFRQTDINDIEFENMFDVIFSNAALHWVKDHTKLLHNTFRALKEKGVLLWDFAGEGNCSNFFSVVRDQMQSQKYEQYFREFEWPWYMPAKADYEKLVAAVGFSVYDVAEVNRDRSFADADEMIKWIDQPSIVPFISILPDDIKGDFRKDVIRVMLERTQQQDGTCFETFRRIHVMARK